MTSFISMSSFQPILWYKSVYYRTTMWWIVTHRHFLHIDNNVDSEYLKMLSVTNQIPSCIDSTTLYFCFVHLISKFHKNNFRGCISNNYYSLQLFIDSSECIQPKSNLGITIYLRNILKSGTSQKYTCRIQHIWQLRATINWGRAFPLFGSYLYTLTVFIQFTECFRFFNHSAAEIRRW